LFILSDDEEAEEDEEEVEEEEEEEEEDVVESDRELERDRTIKANWSANAVAIADTELLLLQLEEEEEEEEEEERVVVALVVVAAAAAAAADIINAFKWFSLFKEQLDADERILFEKLLLLFPLIFPLIIDDDSL
jgi:hypothetical protein